MRQLTVNTPYMVGEVHFYLTEIRGELTLFDAGPPTDEAWAFLQRHVDLQKLRHVFITHAHIDHCGLAPLIAENSDAAIYIPRKDMLKGVHHDRRIAFLENELRGMGFDDAFLDRFNRRLEKGQIFPVPPQRAQTVEDSPIPERLGISVLSCPGHSQSDLVYLVGDQAVTGDILLRGIFQVPLLDLDLDSLTGRFQNYEAYCQSLLKLRALKGMEVLPGHRKGIDSLEETVLFYTGKLIQRAEKLASFPDELSVKRIIAYMYGETFPDPFVAYLKASEIVFMRDYLARPDLLAGALAGLGLSGEGTNRRDVG